MLPGHPSLKATNRGTFGEEDSRNQKNGLSVISGGGNKNLKSLKEHSERGRPESELSEKEILQGDRKILDSIEVHKKPWTGGRRKKYAIIKTRVIAGRIPVDLLNEINRFPGSKTDHLEKALRLYVQIMKETV